VAAALTPVVNFNARAQLRIRAASWSRPAAAGSSEGTMLVVGELDAQTRKLPAWTTGVQADVAVIAADGRQVASQRVDLKPNEGAFSVEVQGSGGMPAGDYTVRVRLRSPVQGELGLSDTARVVLKEAATLGEAVVWRRGPTTGPQYVRTADPRFQRTERIRLELATSAPEPVTARLVDRNGTAMAVQPQVSERPDATAPFKWVVVDLALAPFAAGDFAIETTQGDGRQLTAFRIVP
jgi:hypothetical protein